jgi:hypothetical protein
VLLLVVRGAGASRPGPAPSVPPYATLMSCMPPQMPRTGSFRARGPP